VSYVQLPFEKFSGLKLRASLATNGPLQALEGQDFDLDDGGVIRRRDGFAYGFTMPVDQTISLGIRNAGANDVLFTGFEDGHVEAAFVSLSAGVYTRTLFKTFDMFTPGISDMIHYGGPGIDRIILLAGGAAAGVYDINAGTNTQPAVTTINPVSLVETPQAAATMPKAAIGAVWAGENRVVYGGFTGATDGPNSLASSQDHVWISEPGDHTKFRTDSFVRLSPGDGEKITAIKAWRDMVFVFKETKFFVLLNTSVSGRGVPSFNFRPMNVGIGCVGSRAIVAARDALYFVGRLGIYATRGDTPELLSQDVDPLWTRNDNSGLGLPYMSDAHFASSVLTWHGERLYYSYATDFTSIGTGGGSGRPTGGVNSPRLLVYDLRYDWWSVWNPFAGAGQGVPWIGPIELEDRTVLAIQGGNAGGTLGGKRSGTSIYTKGASLDGPASGGLAISSVYHTGFADLGEDSKVRVRQVEMWGSGAVNTSVFGEFRLTEGAALVAEQSVTLTNGVGLLRNSFVAQRASVRLRPTGSVSRLVLHLANKRIASVT
jgi:hypothetical protein